MPNTIRTIQGTAINAALGFYNTLSSLIGQIRPQYLVAALDYPKPTFRHKLYPLYKANRPPMPAELKQQLPMIRDILTACSIPILEIPGYEADDIIGTVARNLPANTEAYIVTTDRDALQLVNKQVSVFVPNRKANKIYNPTTVEFEWQVKPNLIPDLKALMGDPSDNIPGINLVGPKTAVKWLTTFGSLDQILAKAAQLSGKAGSNLRKHRKQAKLYQNLATIKVDTPITWCWQSLKLTDDFSPLRTTLNQIGIKARLPLT